MQVLPFMASLKILSTQLVANAFLAIVSILFSALLFFVGFGHVKEERRLLRRVVLDLPKPILPFWQGPIIFGPCLPARVG